jgi:hypothetical protein
MTRSGPCFRVSSVADTRRAEWFKANRDEVLAIYRFIEQPVEEQGVPAGDRRAALVK